MLIVMLIACVSLILIACNLFFAGLILLVISTLTIFIMSFIYFIEGVENKRKEDDAQLEIQMNAKEDNNITNIATGIALIIGVIIKRKVDNANRRFE